MMPGFKGYHLNSEYHLLFSFESGSLGQLVQSRAQSTFVYSQLLFALEKNETGILFPVFHMQKCSTLYQSKYYFRGTSADGGTYSQNNPKIFRFLLTNQKIALELRQFSRPQQLTENPQDPVILVDSSVSNRKRYLFL